jgi:murein DD-endopeptidase MepM/ murein hydrolase activator NlpD
VISTGLVVAGLYAGCLGPAGALAQDPTPGPEATIAPQGTVVAPNPDPTVAVPEMTPEATPESTPESTPEPTATPDPTPTPTAMPSPTPAPEETPAAPAPTQATDAPEAGTPGQAAIPAPGQSTEPSPECPTAGELELIAAGLADETDEGSTSARGSECDKRSKKTSKGKGKSKSKKRAHGDRAKTHKPAAEEFEADGTPTLDNPTVSLAAPGPAPIGVPNFFIEKFRIPPFLLPIYQAAGMEYGVRWEVLAAINEIETDYGRNLNVSSAGAVGWMQFMPATWEMYGTDANKDGVKDPFNPVDAIFAAARYLRAAGADTDIRKAIFAYNHADWYVDSVILRARMIGGLPSNFVGSLTGLTQARFPVYATARYAGSIDTDKVKTRRMAKGSNAALPVEGDADRRGIKIFAKRGAPVIAVNDGRVLRIGTHPRLGNYVQLQDVYGNVFTYGHLKSVARTYPAPRPKRVTRAAIAKQLALPKADPKPTAAASETAERTEKAVKAPAKTRVAAHADRREAVETLATSAGKERLYAHPARPNARKAGGEVQLAEAGYDPSADAPLQLNRRDYTAKKLVKGARVIAGTTLGRIGRTSKTVAPHVLFEIRPAGRGAPRIDPKPILDGWKLLESTEIYRAAGKNPFFGPDAKTPSIGQILLMSKEALQRHVLANPRIQVYDCGRRDIRIGAIDRRVLATLEFLAASGLKPTVTSLQCGHGTFTASGNVSEHSSGNAVDIAAINGITITPATQGEGSVTEMTIQRLLTLQGTMKPHQIISLMDFENADNTLSMGDHDDHIHVGFQPLYDTDSKAAKQVNAVLKPHQWIKLIDRLGEIDNPTVRETPSKYALKVVKRGDVAAD